MHPWLSRHSQSHKWAVLKGVSVLALVLSGCSVSPSPSLSPLGGPSVVATPASVEPGLPTIASLGPQMTFALLIGVGVLGFLITVALIYALIRLRPRRSGSNSETETGAARRRAAAGSNDLLPEGTLLDEGRFLVLGGRVTKAGNVYEVKATTPLSLCPTCYTLIGGADVQVCPTCGGTLDATRPEHPVLLAREHRDPERFARISDVVARQLAHPAVVAPVAVFVETSFGEPRYFQVEPDIRDALASRLDLPQPLERVLVWGSALARGLAYLHQQGVVLDAVTRDLVLVDATIARWVCFDRVGVIPQDDPSAAPQFFHDNRDGLSRLLLKLATGTEKPAAAETLPEPAAEAFSRALRSGYPRAGDFADALEAVWRTLSRRQPVAYAVGACTDVGHVRNLNEDSLLVMDVSEEVNGLSVGAFVVADGVGGHSAGDVASRLTVKTLAGFRDRLLQETLEGQLDPEAWIGDAASAANAAVHREREAASSDMGCTLVMALLIGRTAKVLNVGDSRAYHLRSQGFQQVTTDHSLVQRLIDIGQLTPEEARRHPQKSVIYRVIGDQLDLAYDLFEVVLQPGEALLLCSDGLTDMVEDAVIWRIWRQATSPQAACEELVARANEAGGYDNITVVIVQV